MRRAGDPACPRMWSSPRSLLSAIFSTILKSGATASNFSRKIRSESSPRITLQNARQMRSYPLMDRYRKCGNAVRNESIFRDQNNSSPISARTLPSYIRASSCSRFSSSTTVRETMPALCSAHESPSPVNGSTKPAASPVSKTLPFDNGVGRTRLGSWCPRKGSPGDAPGFRIFSVSNSRARYGRSIFPTDGGPPTPIFAKPRFGKIHP